MSYAGAPPVIHYPQPTDPLGEAPIPPVSTGGDSDYPQGQAQYSQDQAQYSQGQAQYSQGQAQYSQGQAQYPQVQAQYPQVQTQYPQPGDPLPAPQPQPQPSPQPHIDPQALAQQQYQQQQEDPATAALHDQQGTSEAPPQDEFQSQSGYQAQPEYQSQEGAYTPQIPPAQPYGAAAPAYGAMSASPSPFAVPPHSYTMPPYAPYANPYSMPYTQPMAPLAYPMNYPSHPFRPHAYGAGASFGNRIPVRPSGVEAHQVIRPSELALIVPLPADTNIDRDLSKLLHRAHRHGRDVRTSQTGREKYTKYVFLSGMILAKRGLPSMSVPDDPDDVYVKLVYFYLADTTRLGPDSERILVRTLHSHHHRHHHHHHHKHHHGRHHRHHRRRRATAENDVEDDADDGSTNGDGDGGTESKRSRSRSRSQSRSRRSKSGGEAVSDESDWEP